MVMRKRPTTYYLQESIFGVVFFFCAYLSGMSQAAAIDVTLQVHPFTITDTIRLGQEHEKITLTARVNIEGARFFWNLKGPGRLEGDTNSRQIVYVPPEALETARAEAVITVTVSNERGEKITKTKTLTLIAGSPGESSPQPAPSPTHLPPDVLEQINNLLTRADFYFQKTVYTEPPGKNAYELYQHVLRLDPGNLHARERICAMADNYRKWGAIAQKRGEEDKAANYHQRYLLLLDYINRHMAKTIVTPSPTPTLPPTPTPTATSTPFPTATPTQNVTPLFVELLVEPDIRTIDTGSMPPLIQLTARTNKHDVQFSWDVQGGMGILQGDTTSPRVSYSAPHIDSGPTAIAPATITVAVTDSAGNTITDSVTFTFIVRHPTPTATPTPKYVASPTPTPTSTATPTPVTAISALEQQLQTADMYFREEKLTTPEEENAFDIYKSVLAQAPSNAHARKKIMEIAGTYKKWGDTAYTQHRTGKAQTYYERYVVVAQYILETFREERISKELEEVQQRLDLLVATPSTPTPKPEVEFRITKVIVRDEDGHPVKTVDDSYQVNVGKPIVIIVSFTNPHNHEIGIAWSAGHGKVLAIQNATNMYTATTKGADYVLITVWDKETGDELSYPINILAVE